MALSEAANKGQFGLYYDCGLIIHHAINQAVIRHNIASDGIYSVWQEYQIRIAQGKNANQTTFLQIVKEYTNQEFSELVHTLSNKRLEKPLVSIQNLRQWAKKVIPKGQQTSKKNGE